jgi:hypothetical protein
MSLFGKKLTILPKLCESLIATKYVQYVLRNGIYCFFLKAIQQRNAINLVIRGYVENQICNGLMNFSCDPQYAPLCKLFPSSARTYTRRFQTICHIKKFLNCAGDTLRVGNKQK